MTPQRFKYTQVVLESLIPLLGFFFWDWGLYFILLFYFIDLLADHVMTHLKARKIIAFDRTQMKQWVRGGILSLSVLLIGVVVIHFAVFSIFPRIDFLNELFGFWTYKELGIQQGFILLPLVFLMAYQQFKMDFLRLRKYETISASALWQQKIRAKVVILGFAALVFGVSQFFIFEEWVYVIGIVFFSGLYILVFND